MNCGLREILSPLEPLLREEKKKKMKMSEPNPSVFVWPPFQMTALPDKTDTVHRIGKRLPNTARPRAIIIQYSSRVTRDVVWRAAKSSEFLPANGLRFTEDLTAFDRGRRLLLWPVVEKALKLTQRKPALCTQP
ncbi:Deoxyribose-phosphate aldolase [Labeo rohita]|uniref:Deoxyribose-phosphate aldolase n=1 Tax=Labeo rohita TaxID=84645 RepID=A0ABQ8M021_LABRO|nr:Deoxyribose-phosphate aldolase [Labeo rohita]